jgi:signal transduction histidine kinase
VRLALADISVMASRDLNLQSVGRRIAEGMRSLIPFDRFSIVPDEPETHQKTLEYFEGIALDSDYFGMDFGVAQIDGDWASRDVNPLDSRWTERDGRFLELGLTSRIAQPIGVENASPTGYLAVWGTVENYYTDEHRVLMREIATQITPAVRNAKAYQKSTQLALQQQQSRELDQANKELQRVADARSEFLSTVSHELRTPLTAILAFADIFHRNGPENLTPRQIDQLDVVRRSSTNLAELIDDLLDVSRADSGQL